MGSTIVESQGVMAASVVQSDYNTAIVPSTTPNYRLIKASQFITPPNFVSANITDAGEATGNAYGNQHSKGRADVDQSFSVYLSFQELGFWARRSFGVAGSPTTVATGVFSQLFSMLNPQVSRDLPSWGWAGKLHEPADEANRVYNFRHRGAVVDSIGTSSPHSAEKPFLQGNIAWRGSGERTSQGVKFFGVNKHVVGTGTSELAEPKIPENGKMTLYPQISKAGTPYVTGCDFYDLSWTINNNLNQEIGYTCAKFQDDDPAKAQIRGQLPITEQTVTLEFTLKATPELRQNADFEALMEAGTEISAEWQYDGPLIANVSSVDYFYKALFSLNRFIVASVDYPTIDSVRGIHIVTAPLPINGAMPFDLLLQTPVANFTTFVGS